MKIIQKGFAKLDKIIKGFIILTIALILIGFGIGFIRVWQVEQERKDIKSINQLLHDGGISEQVKMQVSLFMSKYPNTKNIVVTDKEDNIIFSANYEGIEGKTKFTLELDATQSGVYGLKDGRSRFKGMGQQERMGPGFGILPNVSDIMKRNSKIMNGKRPPMNRFEGNIPFLNSYKISDNLNIYYISKEFRENILSNIMRINGMLLRFLALVFWILIAVWIYKDSKEKGLNPILWGILGIITGVIGLIIYLIYRHSIAYCGACNSKIDKNAEYCANCGFALKTKCTCGQILNSGMNFCPKCGTKREVTQK